MGTSHLCLTDHSVVILWVENKDGAKKEYTVHRELLSNASPVFNAAFSGHFVESDQKSMQLEDVKLEAVEGLFEWLYTRNINLPERGSTEKNEIWLVQCANLFILADKYNIPELRNGIIDRLFDYDGRAPSPNLIKYVYENTGTASAFRKWLVAWYTERIDCKWYSGNRTRGYLAMIPEFALDLALEFGQKKALPQKKSIFDSPSSCSYETA